jgi:hypothetical protein
MRHALKTQRSTDSSVGPEIDIRSAQRTMCFRIPCCVGHRRIGCRAVWDAMSMQQLRAMPLWACSCCIDMDARRISFCKNGESQGHAFDVPTVTLPLHLHCGYPPECASAKHVHRSTPRHIAHCANRGKPGEPRIFFSFLLFSGLGHPRRSIPGGLPQGRHVPAQLRRIPVRRIPAPL